jgi:uncharacterized membrane protein
MTIRNPVEWGIDQFRSTGVAMGSLNRGLHPTDEQQHGSSLIVRRITIADLGDVLKRGFRDFGANRTDIVFLCLIYPVVGLVLARVAAGSQLLPLLFPLVSGFALVGPIAGLGLYEMSRRRELGISVGWRDVFGVLTSPSLGAIVLLSLTLTAIYVIWLLAAFAIYAATLGPAPPASIASFVHDVFTTYAGWVMIIVGVGLGFIFAVVALAISVVAFPLLLDREVGLDTAVGISVRAVVTNPVPMAVWGLIVTGGLVVGSIPLFVGLAVALPVLGHSTWHLYRKLVIPHRSISGDSSPAAAPSREAGF